MGAKRRTEPIVWIGWFGALLNLDSAGLEEVSITNSREVLSVTELDCLQKRGRKGFEVLAPRRNPRFCMMLTWREGSSIWACPGAHAFVYCPAMMKKLESTLCMEEVICLPLSVFVGHGYLQYGSPDCNGSHRLGYQVHFIPSDVQLKDEIEFVYGVLMTPGASTGADGETVEVVKTLDQVADDVKSEEAAVVPEIWNYLISSEIHE